MDAPIGARESFGSNSAWSGADMCPASDAATDMPRARMGFADRVQYIRACSKHLLRAWFSRSRLSTVAPYLRLTFHSADGLAVAAYAAATGAR